MTTQNKKDGSQDTREPVRASEDGGILDEAHLAINALGGAVQKGNVRDEVYNEAIGDALVEIEKLGGRDPVNLTVLRNALLDIVARGPKAEPENPKDEFGYFRGSGNEGDIADDVRAWERWQAAQIAGKALFATRPDGTVDEEPTSSPVGEETGVDETSEIAPSKEQEPLETKGLPVSTKPPDQDVDGLVKQAIEEGLFEVADKLREQATALQTREEERLEDVSRHELELMAVEEERDDLKHDLERYMDIANEHVDEGQCWERRYKLLKMCFEHVVAERDKLKEQVKRRDIALQDLTPGGSEYVNDPDRCVAFVKETRDGHHELIKEWSAKNKSLKEQVERLEGLLKPFADVVEWADGVQEGDRDADYPRHAEFHMGSGATRAGFFLDFEAFLTARTALKGGR